VLLALSRQDFLGLLKQNHEVTLELIRVLARRLRETDEQIRGLLFERVEGRTRRVLARHAREPVPGRPGFAATQALTHQQLADLVGTSRETITRVIKELKDEGWLVQEGKRYLVRVEDEA
jgi:CRP-like cAMP-binding protein